MVFTYQTQPQAILKALEGGNIKKILAVRISRVGDLLFTTPTLRCLKARFPGAEIHYLTNKYAESAIRHNPHVKKIHLLERKSLAWRLFKKAPVLKTLQRENFEMAIFFRCRKEFQWLAGKLKIPYVFAPAAQTGVHFAEGLLKGFEVLDVPDDGLGLDVCFAPQDEIEVDHFLKANNLENTPFYVFHAACYQLIKNGTSINTVKRTWPLAHWADLIKIMHRESGLLPVLSEMSSGDVQWNQRLKATTGLPVPIFSASGTCAFAALLKRSAGFVGLDSGPLHVASAMQVPTIALFGPSRPSLTGPFRNAQPTQVLQVGLPCSPCKGGDIKCAHRRCMHDISAEDAWTAIQATFKQPQPAS